MSSHGRDGDGSPDVTARVMQRLGYVQADAQRARSLRMRTLWLRIVQGMTMVSAAVLGAIWWFGGHAPAPSQPAMVETLRSQVVRSQSDLNGLFAALPRLPQTSVVVQVEGPMPADPPSASLLEAAPEFRSY